LIYIKDVSAAGCAVRMAMSEGRQGGLHARPAIEVARQFLTVPLARPQVPTIQQLERLSSYGVTFHSHAEPHFPCAGTADTLTQPT
jgi:hypothetical protein